MRTKDKSGGGGAAAGGDAGEVEEVKVPAAETYNVQASLMSSGALEHCKNHPRMLKSNATSHVWSLGALAELIDNAQDDEAQAKNVYVSGGERDGDYAITVEDDGVGMTRPKLHCMLSFGFSQKEHLANNVGRFGIGFKSGSMRLGKDVIVFTREDNTASVALLSQSFLDDVQADDILIPMFTWGVVEDVESGKLEYAAQEPHDPEDWDRNMAILTKYSRYTSEDEIVAFMDSMPARTGTSITIFTLKEPLEFDFSVPDDIRVRDFTNDDNSRDKSKRASRFQQTREGQQMSLDVPEDYSFRKYLEILFLRPRVNIYLQGVQIEFRCPIERMDLQRHTFPEYRPHGFSSGVVMHLGYATDGPARQCGTHIYHKNRLIRMYQRFGSQLQANCMMKDMLGVAEAECLTPTHNKQAFDESQMIYARFKSHVHNVMQKYYYNIQTVRTAGGGGRGEGPKRKGKPGRPSRKNRGSDSEGEEDDYGSDDSDASPRPKKKIGRPPKNGPLDLEIKLPLSGPVGMLQCAAILERVMKHKEAWPFLEPVDVVAYGCPTYYEIVKRPMDFGTVKTNLTEGRYRNMREFKVDVEQIFINAVLFNGPEGEVTDMANNVQEEFNGHWALLEGKVHDYVRAEAIKDEAYRAATGGLSRPVSQAAGLEGLGVAPEGAPYGAPVVVDNTVGGLLIAEDDDVDDVDLPMEDEVAVGHFENGGGGGGGGGGSGGGGEMEIDVGGPGDEFKGTGGVPLARPFQARPPSVPSILNPAALQELVGGMADGAAGPAGHAAAAAAEEAVRLELLEERARREAAEGSVDRMRETVEGLQAQLRSAGASAPQREEAGEEMEEVKLQNAGLMEEVGRLQAENDELRQAGAGGGPSQAEADATNQWLEGEVKRLREQVASLAAQGKGAQQAAAAQQAQHAKEVQELRAELGRAREAAQQAQQAADPSENHSYFQLQTFQLEQQNGELQEEVARLRHVAQHAQAEVERLRQEAGKMYMGGQQGMINGGGVTPAHGP